MVLEYKGRSADVEVWKDGLHIWSLGPPAGREYVNYIDLIDYVIDKDEDFKVLEFELGEKQIIVAGIFEA